MTTPPQSRPRTVLYLAETDVAARAGAADLEGVPSGPDRTVQPLRTDAVDRLRNWAPEADCVVFAETPTTAAGANLLEVVDACGETPLVLYTEAAYAPTAARSTDGIDGYVRRSTDDAVSHLADEIEWVCHGAGVTEADASEDGSPDEGAETAIAVEPVQPDDSTPTNDPVPTDDRSTIVSSLERLTELAAWRERDGGRERCYESLVEFVAGVLETEYCWLSTVHFGEFTPRAGTSAVPDSALEPTPLEGPIGDAFRAGEPLRIDEFGDDLEPPFDGSGSLCSVPVGDVGVVQIAAAESDAFDDSSLERLEACCRYAAAVLERTEATTRLRTERDRARRERTRLEAERDRLETERERVTAERDGVTTERDRLRAAFASLPTPALRYELEDGRPVARAVTDAFVDTFDVSREGLVGREIDGDETAAPPGLEDRAPTLADAVRANDRREFVSRRETVDGVREFLLTVAPCSLETDSGTADTDAAGDGETRGDATPSGETASDATACDSLTEGLVVYTDVTDANRLERELAAAENRLETIARVVDDDVRTPLNVARGYLELAGETGDSEHFREVDDAQERLLELLDQLASIARRDDALVDTEPVALHDVARRAWVVVETGDARLVTEENLVLEADKPRLQELFEHLLRSAVGGEGTAEADDRARDEPAVVTVGATADGFYVASSEAGIGGSTPDGEPENGLGQLAAADGTGFQRCPVERIADLHGWDVGVAEDDDRIAFAFRGVESAAVDDHRKPVAGDER